jgi:hypothetical protein
LLCDLGQFDIESLEVRLEDLVNNNLLLESFYNIRVFLSLVFRTDHFLDGRRRSMELVCPYDCLIIRLIAAPVE